MTSNHQPDPRPPVTSPFSWLRGWPPWRSSPSAAQTPAVAPCRCRDGCRPRRHGADAGASREGRWGSTVHGGSWGWNDGLIKAMDSHGNPCTKIAMSVGMMTFPSFPIYGQIKMFPSQEPDRNQHGENGICWNLIGIIFKMWRKKSCGI